jgi:exodeoxyribonuclease VII large subunit
MNVFSVSQFVDFVNTAFSTAVFPEGAVIEGEVVEYRVSQQKWIWFKLKDESSIVGCFATVWQLRTPLEDGMKVRVFGIPKVHPKSGTFSVNVERVELVGEGALRRAFELLKKKLEAEGIFAVERKRPIPRFPGRIGLIASRESAAYGDFLRILGNRWGGVEVVSANVAVQGRDAVREIVGAFRHFNAHPESADVLVLTRGGGSLEDLQAFNSEEVARAVFGSRIPVVVGVGHERDESLADYAADLRASTPTNAAELVVPDRREMLAAVDGGAGRMMAAMRGALSGKAEAVIGMAAQIESHARRGIEDFGHRVKDLGRHFASFSAETQARSRATVALAARLAANAGFWAGRLDGRLDADLRLLRTLDPRRPLEKGYALVRKGGALLKDATMVDAGDVVQVQLARGGFSAEVTDKK